MIQSQLQIEKDLVGLLWIFKIDRTFVLIPISMTAFWLSYILLCYVVSLGTTIEGKATRSVCLLSCSVLAYLLTFCYNTFDKHFESRVNYSNNVEEHQSDIPSLML